MKKEKKLTPAKASAKVKSLNDKMFREICLKRDRYTCQICGKAGNQVHHIFSRGHINIRWEFTNGITLCNYHHIFFAHKDPYLFKEKIIGKNLTQEEFDELLLRSGKPEKINIFDMNLTLTKGLEVLNGKA